MVLNLNLDTSQFNIDTSLLSDVNFNTKCQNSMAKFMSASAIHYRKGGGNF